MTWNSLFSPLAITSSDPLPKLIITHLTSWSAITVTGTDTKSYLQGQLTCDVVSVADDQSTLGAHCDPKGKMWSIFRLFHHGEGLALFQHADALDTALTELKKYAVFSQVSIANTTDVALGVIGEQADAFINSLSEQQGDVRGISGGTAVKVSHNRWLLLLSEDKAAELVSKTTEADFADETIWDCCDIQEAVPRITIANQNEHIPQALNLHLLDGVCFTKGCYTGQETVARAKYRGANKRGMFKVSGHCDALLSKEPLLERRVGDNWRSAGPLITQYQYSNGDGIGLIVLPLDLEPNTELRLKDTPDNHWKIDTQPYLHTDDEDTNN
jgi:hypothetical protein